MSAEKRIQFGIYMWKLPEMWKTKKLVLLNKGKRQIGKGSTQYINHFARSMCAEKAESKNQNVYISMAYECENHDLNNKKMWSGAWNRLNKETITSEISYDTLLTTKFRRLQRQNPVVATSGLTTRKTTQNVDLINLQLNLSLRNL